MRRLGAGMVLFVAAAVAAAAQQSPVFRAATQTVSLFATVTDATGRLIPQLAKETAAYTSTRGSLHFAVDEPLPEALVQKLLAMRMAEAFDKG